MAETSLSGKGSAYVIFKGAETPNIYLVHFKSFSFLEKSQCSDESRTTDKKDSLRKIKAPSGKGMEGDQLVRKTVPAMVIGIGTKSLAPSWTGKA